MAGIWQTAASFTDKITPFAPKTNGNSWATDPLGIMAGPKPLPAPAAPAPMWDGNTWQRAQGAAATAASMDTAGTAGAGASQAAYGAAPVSSSAKLLDTAQSASASKLLLGA